MLWRETSYLILASMQSKGKGSNGKSLNAIANRWDHDMLIADCPKFLQFFFQHMPAIVAQYVSATNKQYKDLSCQPYNLQPIWHITLYIHSLDWKELSSSSKAQGCMTSHSRCLNKCTMSQMLRFRCAYCEPSVTKTTTYHSTWFRFHQHGNAWKSLEMLSKSSKQQLRFRKKGPQRGSSPFQVLLVNVVDISCSGRLYLSQWNLPGSRGALLDFWNSLQHVASPGRFSLLVLPSLDCTNTEQSTRSFACLKARAYCAPEVTVKAAASHNRTTLPWLPKLWEELDTLMGFSRLS